MGRQRASKKSLYENSDPLCNMPGLSAPTRLEGPGTVYHNSRRGYGKCSDRYFQKPPVKFHGENCDCFVACVDRHSGWIVALPFLLEGLTSDKVAKAMYQSWRNFGIPSLITSDQGPQFVGGWWKHMCSQLGVHHAYSQAYHHPANGRAEVAGQQLMERLRLLHTDHKINWVEALPLVVDRIHDLVGETGYSPYEIVFGRSRPLGNLPYRPERFCEDAQQFFPYSKSGGKGS